MTRKEPATAEWYAACFAELVSEPEVRRAAQIEIAKLMQSSGVTLHNADLEAARPYLRRCVENMSTMELESLGAESAGALWARGALGAARYRQRQGKRRRLRDRGRPPTD